MAATDTAIVTLHLVFAAVWTGTIVFFAWRIQPLVAAGDIGVQPTERIVSGLRWLTRISAVFFLVTGGHLAASRYSISTLVGGGRGHLVLTMLALWLLLTGLVETAGAKMHAELDKDRLRTAGKETETLIRLAALTAIALLIVGGLLAS